MLEGFSEKHRSYPGESPCDSTVWHWGCFKSHVVVLWASFQAEPCSVSEQSHSCSSFPSKGLSHLCWPGAAEQVGFPACLLCSRLYARPRKEEKWPIRMHAGVINPRPDWGVGEASPGLTLRASWISSLLVPLHHPPTPRQPDRC